MSVPVKKKSDGQHYYDDTRKIIEKKLVAPDLTDAQRKAQIEIEVIKTLVKETDSIGQALLIAFWHLQKMELDKEFYYTLEYKVKDLVEFAYKIYGDDKARGNYAARWAHVVQRFFVPLYVAQKRGNPFVNNKTGEAILPEYFLEGEYLHKLKLMSGLFEQALESGNSETADKIINAVANDKPTEVKALKDGLTSNAIAVLWKYRIVTTTDDNGEILYRPEFEAMPKDRLNALVGMLGQLAEER